MNIKLIAVAVFATLTIVSCTKENDTTPDTTTPDTTTTTTTNTSETKVAGLEDVAVDSMGYYNGSDKKGGFVSSGVIFENKFDTTWSYWSGGFSASNVNDMTTAGSVNQYASIAGSGANSTMNYAVGQNGAKITLPEGAKIQSAYVTNSTYAALSMQDGDTFAKQFGNIVKDSTGAVLNDGNDWFLLTITGYASATDSVASGKVEVYLADFRNSKREIIKDWKMIDLSSLTDSKCLKFNLTSSDVGQWGMNTPAYFAIDEINYTK